MRNAFKETLCTRQDLFGINLDDRQMLWLANYYDLIRERNEYLNLVAPMNATEFAIRHILESLTLLAHLPDEAAIADVGPGAGLPSIPCLLVREGLKGILIESKEKKVKFLTSAVDSLQLADRVTIVHKQFEESDPGGASYVTCRALDNFTQKLPRLLKWSRDRGLLLFGGHNLREALQKHKLNFDEQLMPLSERRFLFVVKTG